ncbi:hypothetical protein [Microbacterium aurum]
MTAATLVWASCVVAQDPCNDTGSIDLTVPVGVGLAVLAVVASRSCCCCAAAGRAPDAGGRRRHPIRTPSR